MFPSFTWHTLARARLLVIEQLRLSDWPSRILVERKAVALAEEEDGDFETMSRWSNNSPAPNRRPVFPLGGSADLERSFSAPPSSSAAVGEAQRLATFPQSGIL
jgi:hypothetical protein